MFHFGKDWKYFYHVVWSHGHRFERGSSCQTLCNRIKMVVLKEHEIASVWDQFSWDTHFSSQFSCHCTNDFLGMENKVPFSQLEYAARKIEQIICKQWLELQNPLQISSMCDQHIWRHIEWKTLPMTTFVFGHDKTQTTHASCVMPPTNVLKKLFQINTDHLP